MYLPRIRFAILSTLFILAAPLVSAQNLPAGQDRSDVMTTRRGTEIPLAEAEYNFYLVTTRSGGSRGAASDLQARLRIGDAEYQALLAHMRSTIEASGAFEAVQRTALCAKRQEISTMQKLGEALDARDRQTAARRAEVMLGTEKILGAAGKARLNALVEEFRATLVMSGVDPVKVAAMPGQDPAAILASMCRDPVSATR